MPGTKREALLRSVMNRIACRLPKHTIMTCRTSASSWHSPRTLSCLDK